MPTSARQYMPLFTKIFGEFATSLRADVGIGPYKGFHTTNISERAGNAYANEKKKQSGAADGGV